MTRKKTAENRIVREKLPYRDCVGIVVFNGRGQVWLGHRLLEKNDENSGEVKLWQLPQGGIDRGESPLTAAKRELYEETGMESISLLDEVPGWLHYDVPDTVLGIALKGKYRGQRQKWFAFHFTGKENEIAINPPPGAEMAEFDNWLWADLEELPAMVVPFKKNVYETLVRHFRPLAARFAQESGKGLGIPFRKTE